MIRYLFPHCFRRQSHFNKTETAPTDKTVGFRLSLLFCFLGCCCCCGVGEGEETTNILLPSGILHCIWILLSFVLIEFYLITVAELESLC
jgi:hypothetical protein